MVRIGRLYEVGEDGDYGVTIFRYILSVREEKEIDYVLKSAKEILPRSIQEDCMTIEEALIQRGHKRGLEQGVEQTTKGFAKRMLSQAFTMKEIIKATELAEDEILKIAEEEVIAH